MRIMFGRGASGVGDPEMSDSERRHASHIMFGRAAQVDYAKARVRVAIGDEDDADGHILTGWLPIGARRAGGDVEWDPIEVDERVMVLSESGEVQNGVVLPGSFYTDGTPPPGAKAGLWLRNFKDGGSVRYDRDTGEFTIEGKAEVTLKVGSASITLEGNAITLSAGGQTLKLGGQGIESSGKIKGDDGLAITGASFTHEGVNIGSTHKHLGVQPGGGVSQGPQP